MGEEILRMENITKIYPNGVMANKDVTLSVQKGEIHALMGENGAGKSTLMKILFGLSPRTAEKSTLRERSWETSSPAETIKQGIGMVHQHFMLVDSLKVYENIVLGMEPRKGPFTDGKKASQMVADMAKKYNLNVDRRQRWRPSPWV